MSLDLSGFGSEAAPRVDNDVASTSRPHRLSKAGALSVSACAVIVCAVAWAIVDGSAKLETVLVGYAALASTAALALLATSGRTRPVDAEPTLTPDRSEPSVAWKLLSTYSISDASRLWCNIEPGATATQESMAWGCALLDAVKEGQLPIVARDDTPKTIEWERRNPHYMTRVTRQSLKGWADAKGHAPAFLRD